METGIIEGHAVVIKGDRIQDIILESDMEYGSDKQFIDAKGGYISLVL